MRYKNNVIKQFVIIKVNFIALKITKTDEIDRLRDVFKVDIYLFEIVISWETIQL